MPNKPSLVINTSPLVALMTGLDDFHVLGEVATLVVPGEVMAELQAGKARDDVAKRIASTPSCAIRANLPSLPLSLQSALGAGEAAVIHTALTESISTVVIDERKGRRTAALPGLRVTGSLGRLFALQRRGLVTSIRPAIARMKAKGIHLSDDLVNEALQLEGGKR